VFHARGLDGSKVAVLEDDGAQLQKDLGILAKTGRTDAHLEALRLWWADVRGQAGTDHKPVTQAVLRGSRMALECTALIPVLMAFGFLLLVLYFHSKGGYEQIFLEEGPGAGKPASPAEAVGPAGNDFAQ
jgi:hypothetical protein